MEKILPVNLNIEINTECWNFIRLAAVLSDEKYLPWYVEKFNNYFIDELFVFNFQEWASAEFLCNYDEVLTFENINNKSNIVQEVIDLINKDGYVILYCDRYFVKGAEEYQAKHERHDLLIHGYDTNLKIFKFVDININGVLWGSHEISFADLEAAFGSAIQHVNEDVEKWTWLYHLNLPASVFYLNKNFNRKPRLEIFYDAILKLLNGTEIHNRISYKNNISFGVKRYGISGYKSYYFDLYKTLLFENKDLLTSEDNEFILYKLKTLSQIKNDLIFKLNYLNETNMISVPVSIIERIKKLSGVLLNAFCLLTKYSYTLDKKTLDNARHFFIEAESLDFQVLTDLKDIFHEYMKNRLAI